jgi:phytoene synthase
VNGKEARVICAETLRKGSKSFALAAKVLPQESREAAAVLYTWCRRADDAIDLAPEEDRPAALALLERDLLSVYAGEPQSDVTLAAFQAVVVERGVPIDYPRELLLGMASDVHDERYTTMGGLLLYCYRVAGTVGLMMCHVMGIRDDDALRYAAHLGIAMQLTNICRDIDEDWGRGRLYVPRDLLASEGAESLFEVRGGALPPDAKQPLARVARHLLSEADRYYRSGDAGLPALGWRSAFAVRAARLVYSAIGSRLARRHYDVTAGRVVVPTLVKIWLLARALMQSILDLPSRALRSTKPSASPSLRLPSTVLRFPRDVLPV